MNNKNNFRQTTIYVALLQKKTLIFLAFIIVIVNLSINAQVRIVGKVISTQNEPLINSNVLVHQAADSSLVKGTITNADGTFSLENIAKGNYFVSISYISFSTEVKFIDISNESVDLGAIVLKNSINDLDQVTVVAKKPLFEQKIDRLVINVENSITSSGSTALDVLERSPGVMVNRQNNSISLSGKAGVVVMINGKLNYMTPDAAVQMLRGMSANTIEKIELLSTPPSNLDAEGNAGYINVVLKKNVNEGLNGSYTLTGGYGKGETGNASFNLNYTHKKLSIYFNYDYLHNGQEQNSHLYRRISLGNDLLETENQALRHPKENNHNSRLGFEYQLTTKTSFSGELSAFSREYEMKNTANDSKLSRNNVLDTLIHLNINETNLWKYVGANFYIQHTFHKNEVLSFSTDYLHYDNNQPVDYTNTWYDGKNKVLFEQMMRSTKSTPINFGVAKMDYAYDLGTKGKVEMGVKVVNSKFKNDVAVESFVSSKWTADPTFTAKYYLNEFIGAAYIAFEKKLGIKTTAKGGFRYEYTQSNLGTIETPNIVDRKYGRLFPSLFVSHEFSKNATLGLTYSRRITRPTFKDLAPFIFFVDPNTFLSGNAALQPAISENLKADYNFKSTLFTFQYSYQANPIATFQAQVKPGTNKQYYIAENQKSLETFSLTIGKAYSPIKWWNMYVNVAGVLSNVSANYNGSLINVKFPNTTLYSSQTFSLPMKWTFEISGYYTSGGLWGISKIKPMGEVNVGLQKKMGRNGGNFTIGYDNIFNSSKIRFNLDLPEQKQHFESTLQFTQPKFKVSWTQNFGNNKMKVATKKADAEEKKRVE